MHKSSTCILRVIVYYQFKFHVAFCIYYLQLSFDYFDLWLWSIFLNKLSFGNISILWKCILLHFLFTDYFLCTSNTILWRGFICEICKLRLKWKTCRIFAHENKGWSVSIMSPTLKQQRRALLLAIEITYWGYKLTYEFHSMFAILVIKFWIFISNRRKFRPN